MRTKEEQIRDARKTIQNELKILFSGVGENTLYNYAIYILDLKKPDGSPLLAILDDDQSPDAVIGTDSDIEAYKDFRRVIL